jgi:hypothetical protein
MFVPNWGTCYNRDNINQVRGDNHDKDIKETTRYP